MVLIYSDEHEDFVKNIKQLYKDNEKRIREGLPPRPKNMILAIAYSVAKKSRKNKNHFYQKLAPSPHKKTFPSPKKEKTIVLSSPKSPKKLPLRQKSPLKKQTNPALTKLQSPKKLTINPLSAPQPGKLRLT